MEQTKLLKDRILYLETLLVKHKIDFDLITTENDPILDDICRF